METTLIGSAMRPRWETAAMATKDKKPASKQSNVSKKPVSDTFKCSEKGCKYTAKSKGAITAHWNKAHRKPHAQKRGTRKRSQAKGRPSVLTPVAVGLLVAAFENGLTVNDACKYAGIGRDAYYEGLKKNTEFADKMHQAQAKLGFKAREVVAQQIFNGNERVAMWWLERRAKEEFSTRKEVTGDDGGPIKTENKELSLDAPVTDKELEEALFGEHHQS